MRTSLSSGFASLLLLVSVGGIGCVVGGTGGTGGAATASSSSSMSGTSSSSTGGGPPIGQASCASELFVDVIPEASWLNVDLDPSGGTTAIRDAIENARDAHPNEPVRIRLAPGEYADTLGGEIYAHHVLRSAAAPLFIVATDPSPNATRLGQGFNMVGVSYIAFEGLTIGPASVGAWNGSSHADPQPLRAQAGIHIAGAAIDGGKSAILPNGELDTTVYGRYEPSHHIIARGMTIQNLFSPDDESGEKALGLDNDGMKFNQTEDVWVIGNSITETSRHGIDNVGVHRAVFCGNAISRTGNGLGIEAKGGSFDVVFEGNLFYRVRRVTLGGETTDAPYYFSVDGAYDYEGKGIVARNNLIVDARESALQFSGCAGCAATNNTVLFTSAYVPPLTDDGDARGGDAIRVTDSVILSSAEGAGSDCVSWDEALADYVYFDQCWGVGANAPAPVGRPLTPRENVSRNNAFLSMTGVWSPTFGGSNPNPSTLPCPLSVFASGGNAFQAMDHDYWFNADKPLASCDALPAGEGSVLAGADPKLSNAVIDDQAGPRAMYVAAASALAPVPGSPLVGAGVAIPSSPTTDFAGAPRPAAWSIGALEPK
ncbi:MAG: right-handed parallel beta-helix repeat-containing protein [Polyangiaceae bacterium]